MGNKVLPVKYTLAAATLTKINTIQKRSQLLLLNISGDDVGVTSDRTAVSTDLYPVRDGAEFVDISQSDIYAESAAGGDIWVWETEV